MLRLQTEFIQTKEEVSEEDYFEMLEVLPPERMADGGFLVGEPTRSNIAGELLYDCYVHKNGRFYYGGELTTKDFDLFTGSVPITYKEAYA